MRRSAMSACSECGEIHVHTACDAVQSRVGEVVGERYRIVRHIGSGGMGSVYEARHLVLGRRFAVKLVRRDLASRPKVLRRFRREAQAAGALESDHIAAIVDFGVGPDEVPYLVMEYLDGADLAQILAETGQLPVPRAVDLVLQACCGLALAHARGIVHRDLKPENLFVLRRFDGTDHVKILDFGIARLGVVDAKLTSTGAAVGTPYYIAPEQARGARDVDARADVYALGVILYEALSGELPHPGESYNEVLYHVLTKPAVPLGELRPSLPTDLCDVVARAIAAEPAERFASADELASALEAFAPRCRAGQPVRVAATRPASAETVDELGAASPAQTSGERRRASPSRLPRWVATAALVAGAGLLLRSALTAPPPRLMLDSALDRVSLPSGGRLATIERAVEAPAAVAEASDSPPADVQPDVHGHTAAARPRGLEERAAGRTSAAPALSAVRYDRANPYLP